MQIKAFLIRISPAQDSRSQNYRELEKWDKHWVPEIITKITSESLQKQRKKPRSSSLCIWVKCIGVINSFLLYLSVTQSSEASDASSWHSWQSCWHPGVPKEPLWPSPAHVIMSSWPSLVMMASGLSMCSMSLPPACSVETNLCSVTLYCNACK